MQTNKQKYNQHLIGQFNQVRQQQKSIGDFKNVAEYMAYVREIASTKAEILGEMEKNNA